MIEKIKYYGKYLIEIYVLFYLIVFTGFNYQIADREILGMNLFVIGIISVVWLAFLLINGKENPNQKSIPYQETFYIFILVYLSSIVHSVNLDYSISELILWSITAFIFFGIYALVRWRVRAKHEIMTSLLVIGIIYNLMKLGQLLFNWQEYINLDCGFRGIFAPNITAGMTNFVLVVSLGLVIASYHRQREYESTREWKRRIIPYVGLITSIIVLFVSGSRGGYIAGSVAVFIMLVVDIFYTRKTRIVNITWTSLILVLIMAFPIVATMINRPSTCQSVWGSNITTRADTWEYSVELFLESPFLGKGPGTYPLFAGPHFDYAQFAVHSHNIYLKILAERGFLGMIASAFFLLVILKIIIEDVQDVAYKLIGVGVLVVFLIHGLVDIPLSEPYLMRYMFALLALVVSASRKQKILKSSEIINNAKYY